MEAVEPDEPASPVSPKSHKSITATSATSRGEELGVPEKFRQKAKVNAQFQQGSNFHHLQRHMRMTGKKAEKPEKSTLEVLYAPPGDITMLMKVAHMVKKNCVGIDLYPATSPIPGARQSGRVAMDFSYMKIQELATISEEGVPVTSIFACMSDLEGLGRPMLARMP